MLRLQFLIVLFLTAYVCNAQVRNSLYDSALYYYYGQSTSNSISLVEKVHPINDSLRSLVNSIHAFALYDQNSFSESERILRVILKESNCPPSLRFPAQVLFANLKFISNKVDSAVLISTETIREIELLREGPSRDRLLATIYLNLGFFSTPRTISKNPVKLKYLLENFDLAEKYIISSRNLNGQLYAYLYLYRALAYYNCGQNPVQVSYNLKKAYEYNNRLSAQREFSEISGYLFYNLNQVEEAVRFLKDTDLNPWYAMALVKSERVDDGLKILSDIINSSTPHPYEKSEASYFLSEYYLEKDHVEALKYFRLAKAYDQEAVAMEYNVYSINRSANKDILNEKFKNVISKLEEKKTTALLRTTLLWVLVLSSIAVIYFLTRLRSSKKISKSESKFDAL